MTTSPALPMAGLFLAALLLAPGRAGARQELIRSGEADAPAGAIAQETYGRWERSLRRCRLERSSALRRKEWGQGCSSVRLDQRERGLLSVRFLTDTSAQGGMAGQLIFAGVLTAGSRPMPCDQLRCRPSWPIRMRVSAVALTGLIETEGPAPQHQGRLARGSCALSARRIRCVARGSDGEEWLAEAEP